MLLGPVGQSPDERNAAGPELFNLKEKAYIALARASRAKDKELAKRASELVDEEMIKENVVCGPDPERHLEAIREYLNAGYDHVYVHQVGPDQDGFFDFYQREVLPELSSGN